MDELVTRIRRGLGANTDANAAFDELMALAGDRMEALVEAIAAERRVRREGHWTEMHMTAVDLASLALELVLVDTECACSCHFHLPPEIRAKSECLACGCGPALGDGVQMVGLTDDVRSAGFVGTERIYKSRYALRAGAARPKAAKHKEKAVKRVWSLSLPATGETRTCSRLWPMRAYYRLANATLCDVIGHDFSTISVFHDEGEPLYECARCGDIHV